MVRINGYKYANKCCLGSPVMFKNVQGLMGDREPSADSAVWTALCWERWAMGERRARAPTLTQTVARKMSGSQEANWGEEDEQKSTAGRGNCIRQAQRPQLPQEIQSSCSSSKGGRGNRNREGTRSHHKDLVKSC